MQQEPTPRTTVRVGIFSFAPINGLDAAGKAWGLNPDLLGKIARDRHWQIEYVPGTWAQGLERLQKEEIDLVMAIAYTAERSQVMDYTYESVAELWGQVFTRPEDKSSHFQDLAGHRVGVLQQDISGAHFRATIKQLGISCQLVEYRSLAEVFVAVQQGEVDAGVAPQHFGLRHADRYDLVPTTIMFSPFSIHFAAKKGRHHQLLSTIDSYLTRWKQDKDSFYYQKIKYWLANYSPLWPPQWAQYVVLCLGGLFTVFLLFSVSLKKAVTRKTQELQESENRFRLAMEATRDGLWDWDLAGETMYQSPGYWAMLGYEEKDAPAGLAAWKKTLHPEDKARVLGVYFACVDNQCESFVAEYRMQTRTGGWKWIQGRGKAVVRDTNGRATRLIGTHADISQRKQAEEEKLRLQHQLVQAQKMEAIGTLAGGIAHDFNNILSAILGYTELALEDLPVASSAAKDLELVHRAGQRAAGLVQQLLTFSRQTEPERILLQPAKLIKDAMQLLRPTLADHVRLRICLESTTPILADPSQLHQILANLCSNAADAMAKTEEATLSIGLKNVRIEAQQDQGGRPEVGPGEFVLLEVGDTGIGMTPDIQEKICMPYFSTKEIGQGSGMGLAIVHGIVESYGGFVRCSSQPGEGAVFQLYFPAASERKEQAKNRGHILFVDDEQPLLDVGHHMLTRMGYQVTAKTNGLDAWEAFQQKPQQFDAVVTDHTMPGLTGGELAKNILGIRPNLPIVLCTGYSSLFSREMATAIGIQGFLLKPLAKNDLAGILHSLLTSEQREGSLTQPL